MRRSVAFPGEGQVCVKSRAATFVAEPIEFFSFYNSLIDICLQQKRSSVKEPDPE